MYISQPHADRLITPHLSDSLQLPPVQRGDLHWCFKRNGISASKRVTLTPQSVCTRAAAAQHLGSSCPYLQQLPRNSHQLLLVCARCLLPSRTCLVRGVFALREPWLPPDQILKILDFGRMHLPPEPLLSKGARSARETLQKADKREKKKNKLSDFLPFTEPAQVQRTKILRKTSRAGKTAWGGKK